MTDVFISHASEDRPTAERFATYLRRFGYSVCIEEERPTCDPCIAEKLIEAKCVVVLWSMASTGSAWVLDEADVAHERGVLIPVRISECKPPTSFGRIDVADMSDWDFESHSRAAVGLLDAISWLAGTRATGGPHARWAHPES